MTSLSLQLSYVTLVHKNVKEVVILKKKSRYWYINYYKQDTGEEMLLVPIFYGSSFCQLGQKS